MKFSEVNLDLDSLPIPFRSYDLSKDVVEFPMVPQENAAHNLLVLLERIPFAERCKLGFRILIDGNEVGKYKGGLQCSLLFGNAPEITVPQFDLLKIKVNIGIDYDIDTSAYIASLEQRVLALSERKELTSEIENAMVGMLGWTEDALVDQRLGAVDQLVSLSQMRNPFETIRQMNIHFEEMEIRLVAAQAQTSASSQLASSQALPDVPVPQPPNAALPEPGVFQTGVAQLPPPAADVGQSPQVELLYQQMLAEGGKAMSGTNVGSSEVRIKDMREYLANLKVTKDEAKGASLNLHQNAGDNDVWKAAISLVAKTCEDAPSWTADTLYTAINSARNATKSISFGAIVEQYAQAVFRVRGEICTATFQAG